VTYKYMFCVQARQQAAQVAWPGAPLRIEVTLPAPVDPASAKALADLHGMLFVHVTRAAGWVGRPLPHRHARAGTAAAVAAEARGAPAAAGAAQQPTSAAQPPAAAQAPPARTQPVAAQPAAPLHTQASAAAPVAAAAAASGGPPPSSAATAGGNSSPAQLQLI